MEGFRSTIELRPPTLNFDAAKSPSKSTNHIVAAGLVNSLTLIEVFCPTIYRIGAVYPTARRRTACCRPTMASRRFTSNRVACGKMALWRVFSKARMGSTNLKRAEGQDFWSSRATHCRRIRKLKSRALISFFLDCLDAPSDNPGTSSR